MIEFNDVSLTYAGAENAGGVHHIDLKIQEGEVVVLCGESGCGKTTMTRLVNGLIPHYYEGEMRGEVLVDNQPVSKQPLYDMARTVGSVFQNPRSQFFNVDTTSEISFGCENLGMPEKDILGRMDRTIRDFSIGRLMGRNIFHLSGGQKQKIACASVSVMHPEVFVLDEPSSNLDASSIADLREILSYWKEQGKTMLISEHRLFYLRGLADRFVLLKDGRIEKEFSAREFERMTEQERRKLGLRTYSLEQLSANVRANKSEETLELTDVHFAYKNHPETLCVEDCQIPAGRITAVIGDNGAGKSTFSRCFCGLEKNCGQIRRGDNILKPKDRLNACYMVMQEVNHQLFTESVMDEVQISMEKEDPQRAKQILGQLDLLSLKDRHPMSLSGGEKQRVAIASAVASDRSILFFDEPTSGLDFRHMQEVAEVLRKRQAAGETIYVITHDLELILDCCTDVVHFENGDIIDQYPLDLSGTDKMKSCFIKKVYGGNTV